MEYLITVYNSEYFGVGSYVFKGTEEEMKTMVRAKVFEFIEEYDDEYESLNDDYDRFTYSFTVQYETHHVTVTAIELKNVNDLVVDDEYVNMANKYNEERR